MPSFEIFRSLGPRAFPDLLVFCLILSPLCAQQPADKSANVELIGKERGALPIVLSAPHGGVARIPDVPEREGTGQPRGNNAFSVAHDTNTDLLLLDVAAAIEAKLGKKPYYVYAKFSRKYVDANRPPEFAYEHPKATAVYEAYHQTLAEYCREVQKTWGSGLLLDIHGQAAARDTVFRGTNNGRTVKLLRGRFGDSAHVGPKSFMGLLAARGMTIYPKDDGKEHSSFTGGYVIQTYGSHDSYGIDAIQLEFGADYRDRKSLKDVADKIAGAVQEFANLYLPAGPRKQ